MLSSVLAIVAIFEWAGFAIADDGARRVFPVFAIIMTLLVIRIFAKIELHADAGTKL